MTIILTREDTGEMAVVRIITPGQHVSAPYSRACGILDRWVAAGREAADQFTASLEGQAAQAAAEIRRAADEQLHQHRQVREDIAERVRREGTVNLPPAFEETPPVWAELPGELPPDPTGELTQERLDAEHAARIAQARAGLQEQADRHARQQARRFTPDPADYGPRPAGSANTSSGEGAWHE